MPAPEGPTKTRSAASRTSRDAAAFSTISGPIPRASPSVTASSGLRSSFTPASAPYGFFGLLASPDLLVNASYRMATYVCFLSWST